MAEGIFNSLAAEDEKLAGRITATSAGILAYEGDCASPEAIRTLKATWGIDISVHRARPVSEEELKSADWILTMTCEHKEVVISRFPEVTPKVFTLKEFVMNKVRDKSGCKNNNEFNISDPYGKSTKTYTNCALEIRDTIEKLILKLKKDKNNVDLL